MCALSRLHTDTCFVVQILQKPRCSNRCVIYTKGRKGFSPLAKHKIPCYNKHTEGEVAPSLPGTAYAVRVLFTLFLLLICLHSQTISDTLQKRLCYISILLVTIAIIKARASWSTSASFYLHTSSLFTITYYLLKKSSLGERSEEAKKYPRNKSEEFFGSGTRVHALCARIFRRAASERAILLKICLVSLFFCNFDLYVKGFLRR